MAIKTQWRIEKKTGGGSGTQAALAEQQGLYASDELERDFKVAVELDVQVEAVYTLLFSLRIRYKRLLAT